MAFAAGALRSSLRSTFLPTFTRTTFQHTPVRGFRLFRSSSSSLSQAQAMAVGADDEQGTNRVYTQYTIYKGKGALRLAPGRPTFRQLEENSYALSKEGALFLEFAASLAPRRYDWEKKQIFALSPLEMATLMDASLEDTMDFTHDPNMGKQDEGKVMKRMKVSPLTNKDGSSNGLYFNLSVKDDLQKVNVQLGIPVSRGEFAIMKSVFNFLIPHLLGWGVHVDPSSIGNVVLEGGGGWPPRSSLTRSSTPRHDQATIIHYRTKTFWCKDESGKDFGVDM